MHRRAHRADRNPPASMSACLSPVQIGLRGFPNIYVPTPAPQGPMPEPMPMVPPYQNAPNFAADSEASSESGAFQRQQQCYSSLASPQIPDHARRPGDPPTPYHVNVPLSPPASEVGGSISVMQRNIEPTIRSPRRANTLRSPMPHQDVAASPNVTPRQTRRPVPSPLALSAIGPLPLTPPYQADLSVSSSESEIGNSIFAPINHGNGASVTRSQYRDNRRGPLSPLGMTSPYGGPASPEFQFDNQGYPRPRGQSPRYLPATSPTENGMLSPMYQAAISPVFDPIPVDSGAVFSATMLTSVVYRSGTGVVSAGAVQNGFIPPYMAMQTTPAVPFPSTYPPPRTQKNSPHSRTPRTRRNRRSSELDAKERTRNFEITLRTGGERMRTRAVSDAGSHPPFIPPRVQKCPYHPENHFYSNHQFEPHVVKPYGLHGRPVPPYDFVTFDETHPCGTSAMKPTKLSKWLPSIFKN
jgi:hypothetical protein